MLHVTRYDDPQAVGWAGYIEPDDKSWIAFISLDGRPVFFLEREPSGAVVPPAPREATLVKKGGK